jgi:hypothetical protein
MVQDLQQAADVLRPFYDSASNDDGFVSIDVSPSWPTTRRGRLPRCGGCGPHSTDQPEADGVAAFAESFTALRRHIEEQRTQALAGMVARTRTPHLPKPKPR